MKKKEEEKKIITKKLIKNVAFFGDANVSKDDPVYKNAYESAKILAKEGFTIVNGGGPGVMEASTRGAKDAKGETISITFNGSSEAVGFEGKYVGNVTDEEIVTTNYIERMFKLMEHSDTFVIFKGGSGTMSEFGTAWVLAKLYYGHHKPFILFGHQWLEIIDAIKKNMNIDKEEASVFEIVEKKEDILPTIKRFQKRLDAHDHTEHCKVCVDKAFFN